MRFWDSSAIVPLVIEEPTTQTVLLELQADPEIMVWWATRVEVVSAIARAHRSGMLSDMELSTVLADARTILDSAYIVKPSTSVADRAERLLLVHDLRAADALQLAAALVAVGESPRNVGFVTLDARLRLAAARESFSVLPAP